MKLEDALQETGCAFFTFLDCTTSVERLPDGMFLVMTRRGVCILQCLLVRWDYLMRRYEHQTWYPGQVQIIRQEVDTHP